MCFRRQYESFSIPTSNEFNYDLLSVYCLAPYFTDLNPAFGGKVYYSAYDLLKTQNTLSADTKVQEMVHRHYNVSFKPVYILKSTWDQVPPFGGREGVRHFLLQVDMPTLLMCCTERNIMYP